MCFIPASTPKPQKSTTLVIKLALNADQKTYVFVPFCSFHRYVGNCFLGASVIIPNANYQQKQIKNAISGVRRKLSRRVVNLQKKGLKNMCLQPEIPSITKASGSLLFHCVLHVFSHFEGASEIIRMFMNGVSEIIGGVDYSKD